MNNFDYDAHILAEPKDQELWDNARDKVDNMTMADLLAEGERLLPITLDNLLDELRIELVNALVDEAKYG